MSNDQMPPSRTAVLELAAVSLRYDTPANKITPEAAMPILSELSFQLQHGEILSLLGPSGCGKTSILRAIAGFLPVAEGAIYLQQRCVSGPALHVAPEQRQIGMVFQDYALFPHLTVAQNVAFGLHQQPRAARQARVEQMLSWVGLSAQASRQIHELSGGQQQRVALARAMAPQPKLLLMDEPFSNLDVTLRERLAQEVRQLLKQSGTSAVIVTHHQHEAFALADRIVVIDQGRLQQVGSAMDLYHRPHNRVIAQFIGEGVLLRGHTDGRGCVVTELGTFPLPLEANARFQVATVDLLVRPDDVVHDDDCKVQAKVIAKEFRGAQFLYTLALPSGVQLLSLVPSHHDHRIGEYIGIRPELDHVVCFAVDTVN